MASAALVEIRNLRKRFGPAAVLDGVDVDIGEGEIFGFLGTNGAGKSTTIHILTGQIRPDGGTARIAGTPAGTKTNRLIGLAPQEIAIYPRLTVRENLRFFAGVHGATGAVRNRQVERILDLMDLRARSDAVVETLSGGWQRRLNLAAALVHQPPIAILDESTVGLDVEARRKVWQAIRTLRNENVTFVLTTHLMDEAEALCDRIGILHHGRIAALGTLEELRALVPAAQLAEVECQDMELLAQRAKAAGFRTRRDAGRLTIFLQAPTTIRDLVDALAPVDVQSVRLRDVTLSDAFLEIASGG